MQAPRAAWPPPLRPRKRGLRHLRRLPADARAAADDDDDDTRAVSGWLREGGTVDIRVDGGPGDMTSGLGPGCVDVTCAAEARARHASESGPSNSRDSDVSFASPVYYRLRAEAVVSLGIFGSLPLRFIRVYPGSAVGSPVTACCTRRAVPLMQTNADECVAGPPRAATLRARSGCQPTRRIDGGCTPRSPARRPAAGSALVRQGARGLR